jgi:nucleotide-binding universal stress UspA family protein
VTTLTSAQDRLTGMAIERILCPLDFSDASRHAIEHALAIARWSGAPVSALHVCRPMVVSALTGAGAGESDPDGDLARLRAVAASLVEGAGARDLRVDVFVEAGDPARQILEHAQRHAASLIVMGTHGTAGFERWLLGSVTEKVLRKARCPVLTVPPHADGAAALPFRQVLCAIDFSYASLAALNNAVALAQESRAPLALLHVVQWPWDEPPAPTPQDMPPAQAAALAEYRRYVEAIALARLATLRRERIPDRVDAVPRVVHGKPYVEILRVAAEAGADLIVIGVHGRNAADLIFGSTANQVVRAAACPVLTSRVQPHSYESPETGSVT